MRRIREHFLFAGVGAATLMLLALASAAVIRHIDNSYNGIIARGVRSREAIRDIERECQVFWERLADMAPPMDSPNLEDLQTDANRTFGKINRHIGRIQNLSPGISDSALGLISEGVAAVKASYLGFVELMLQEEDSEALQVAHEDLRSSFVAFSSVLDHIYASFNDEAFLSGSALAQRNNRAMNLIERVAYLTLGIWCIALIVLLYPPGQRRKNRPPKILRNA